MAASVLLCFCRTLGQGPSRRGLGETDPVRSVDDDDDGDVNDDLVGMIFFVSCYWFFCFVVLVLVVIALMYCTAKELLRRYNFVSHPYLKRLEFCDPRIYQSSNATKSHPPTRFYCPPQSKNVVLIPKIRLFTDFCPFFARKTVKYKPISKWFSFSDSSWQALQHCRAKFVATQTSLHENNY